jgi:hypothetical protein
MKVSGVVQYVKVDCMIKFTQSKEAAMDGDRWEVVELERMADWRIKKLGGNPGAMAAQLL